jgi:hypothetical protein
MTRKKTDVQLDREIAAALAAAPPVKISVHEVDTEEDDDNGDESYIVSDDGDEFDDSEETPATDVQGEIDERRLHYRALGRRVVLDAPERGWQ